MKNTLENNSSISGAIVTMGLWLGVLWFVPGSHFAVFPYEMLSMRNASGRWHNILTPEQGMFLNVMQWSVVTLVFAALARNYGSRSRQLAAPLAIVLVTLAMHVVVRGIGMTFYWDLWH